MRDEETRLNICQHIAFILKYETTDVKHIFYIWLRNNSCILKSPHFLLSVEPINKMTIEIVLKTNVIEGGSNTLDAPFINLTKKDKSRKSLVLLHLSS